ncbi:Probable E3 ubiquitin-protein ligase sinah, partial [Gryllus bimaculatus]
CAELDGEPAERPRPPSPDSTAGRQSVYNEDLVASLVCAACAHYMVAPIEQCKRGHNICKFCRRRAHQHRCPVCSARLSGIRNVVAEDMARKLLFPCVHAHAGCSRQ